MSLPSRRRFVRAIPLAGLAGTTLPAAAWSLAGSQAPASSAGVPEWLPKQNPVLAKETVGVSHRDLTRVRELVEPQPALARAAYDRGCGDGETALGAASQTGRREIAEFLIASGAQPTMCSATMLGHLDVVKAFVAASPGIQRTPGPHGIPLLAHARAAQAQRRCWPVSSQWAAPMCVRRPSRWHPPTATPSWGCTRVVPVPATISSSTCGTTCWALSARRPTATSSITPAISCSSPRASRL